MDVAEKNITFIVGVMFIFFPLLPLLYSCHSAPNTETHLQARVHAHTHNHSPSYEMLHVIPWLLYVFTLTQSLVIPDSYKFFTDNFAKYKGLSV